jgi:hypothetical protein
VGRWLPGGHMLDAKVTEEWIARTFAFLARRTELPIR